MEFLIQHIEALIFSTEHPITIAEMKSVLNAAFETEFADDDILRGIEELKIRYSSPQFSFEIIEIAGGFQFLTKPIYHNSVGTYLRQTIRKRLSQAALETLTPRRREIILLRFSSGLRNQEIASVLNLDERTVASHLCRALEDLQQQYQQEELADEQ